MFIMALFVSNVVLYKLNEYALLMSFEFFDYFMKQSFAKNKFKFKFLRKFNPYSIMDNYIH
jgi:hypothetical protein